ncbi:MAG TPA: hypothetical protein VFU86_05385 [Terriglobales bacterium]|nr:hypothetical protein [Terriglobales bacterium]
MSIVATHPLDERVWQSWLVHEQKFFIPSSMSNLAQTSSLLWD